MFSEELKESTRQVHAVLEKQLVAQIRKIQTVEEYIHLLEMMYGYYYPLQQLTSSFLPQMGHPLFGRQAGNLLNDIRDLDPAYEPEERLSEELPEVNSAAAAMGVLYVTEGSTLGGRIITKMISAKLGLPPDRGFSFFNVYGEETEEMWERFRAILNTITDEQQRTEARTSAQNTFTSFQQWITAYESGNYQSVRL